MSTFIETADSRETSTELMEAILFIAGGNETLAEMIWTNPSDTELLEIFNVITKNGLINASEFCWGANGNKWAESA